MTMLPDGLITGFTGGAPNQAPNPQGAGNNPVLQKFVGALEAMNEARKMGSMPAPMTGLPPPVVQTPSAFPVMPRPAQEVASVAPPPMQRFDDGGVVQSIGDVLRPVGQAVGSVVDAIRPKDGVFTRDQYGNTAPMTDTQRFASFLLNTAGGANENFSGAANWYNNQQKQRLDEMAAERAAAGLMGTFRGSPTLQAQQDVGMVNGQKTVGARQVAVSEAQSPTHIQQMEEQIAASQFNRDKVYQVQLAAQQQLAKQLQQIQMQEASGWFSDDPVKNSAEAAKARAAAHDQTNQMVQRILATPRTGDLPKQTPAPQTAPSAPAYIFDRNGNLVPKGQ